MPYKYLIFNKPYKVLCQFTDEAGRKTLKDFISVPGVYSVGRLDYDSEGLLLLTDDGVLNHKMSDPGYQQPKTYWAQVEKVPSQEELDKIRNGVVIGGKRTLPAKVKRMPEDPAVWERSTPIRFRKTVPTCWLEITVNEGMNRQVRKMTAAIGHPCLRLIRVAIGSIQLNDLKPGEYAFIEKPKLR